MSNLQHLALAETQARLEMDRFGEDDIRPLDRPNVENVFIALLMFEHPIPALRFSVTRAGPQYSIVVKGYKKRVDVVDFVSEFRGTRRDAKMNHVQGVQAQLNEQAFVILLRAVNTPTSVSESHEQLPGGDEEYRSTSRRSAVGSRSAY